MSNLQVPLSLRRAFPGEDPTQRRPGFDYIKAGHSNEEKAVRSEGYAWVQTNYLQRHLDWMGGVGPGMVPENMAGLAPDRLNPHGHHGPNTHRIVTGQLTLRKIDPRGGGLPHQVTISDNGVDPVSAPVRGDEVYDGFSTRGTACTFVEGHACLSPTTALRFMDGKTLRWFGADGKILPEDQQDYVKAQLAGAETFRDDRNAVSFTMRGEGPVADDMTAWFEEEWQRLEQMAVNQM